jgi:hypothetical protein
MLSIGLWQWYINITITILDIIHRPVFYFEKERKKEIWGGGGSERHYQQVGGARNKYCCSEGSQAMIASPSDSVKFKFNVVF